MTSPQQIGRFRILGLLGQGAMGTVYRGRDESLEREVAVKVMSLGQADAEARARFLREARAAARLQHPNIVTIYELGEHEGSPFMALELLEGIDLQRAIENGIRPDPKVTLPIVIQALAGLAHAHENGIVHRDVKPSNIFLPRNRPAKIMDFGVARLVGGATTAGLVVGTPNYMSPEQVKAGDLDGRSDLFSVGLILYELVTGEKAYRGDSVVTLLYKIVNEPPDLNLIPKGREWERLGRVLAGALAKDPADRFPDAPAMASELLEALLDLGGSPDALSRSDLGLMGRTQAARAPEPAIFAPAADPEQDAVTRKAPVPRPPPRPILIAALAVGALAVLAVAARFLLAPAPERPAVAPPALPETTVATTRPAAPLPASTSVTTVPTGTPPPVTPSPSAAPTPRPAASSPSPDTAPAGPSPADARLDRANDFMEKQRYGQALAEARAILARDPNNGAARALAGDAEAAILIEDCVKKAKAALLAGDRDQALLEIRKGLSVNPNEGRLLALHREATQ